MARSATIHVCTACGHETARWLGQCPGCGAWGTITEERATKPTGGRGGKGASGAGGRAAGG
ncbi:DNA repair protein RadA, partial [Patulibacter sp. S7RM1-6]